MLTTASYDFSIDWISATLKQNAQHADFSFVKAFDEISQRTPCKPLHGYNAALKWKFGAMVMWHDKQPNMGTHFVMSGEPLRELHNAGYDAVFILARFATAGANLTRVDLALDIHDSGIMQPDEMHALLKQRAYKGRAQSGSLIDHTVKGATCYIGSWDSERFVRFYDKAKEQRVTADWKRLELILKGRYARTFALKFAQEPTITHAARVFKGTVKSMATFNVREYLEALEGETQALALPQKIGGKTREWLLTQVCSAIARYIAETGEDTILDKMGEEITAKYDEIMKQK